MSKLLRAGSFALLAIFACVTIAGPPQQSAQRARWFAKLPNWSGIWLSVAWPLEVSGRVAGGEAKLRSRLQLIAAPPYNPEWLSRYEQSMRDTAAIALKDATFSACTRSFPALMEGPWLFQVLVLPEETVLLFENGQARHIYTDGRDHPRSEDLWPTRLGDSVGRWEGDTLRIDTIARTATEPVTIRAWASLLSEQAHFIERLRMIDENTLEDALTIEDPIALATPWRIHLTFSRQRNIDRMLDYNCTENERISVVDGKMIIRDP
jgi:hypothetical protein